VSSLTACAPAGLSGAALATNSLMSSHGPDTPLTRWSTWHVPCLMLCGYRVQCAGKRASQRTEGVRAMTEYLIAVVLFVAIITTLVYLWKREH
jgi:hypothetical protein